MTIINCEVVSCKNNKNKTCTKDIINLMLLYGEIDEVYCNEYEESEESIETKKRKYEEWKKTKQFETKRIEKHLNKKIEEF